MGDGGAAASHPQVPKHYTDLSQLPRVRLVRPELASIPRSRGTDETVRCALGCAEVEEEDNRQCTERRKDARLPHPPHPSLLDSSGSPLNKDSSTSPPTSSHATEIITILLALAEWAADATKHLHLPLLRFQALEILRSPDATTQQKADSLRTTLAVTGQVVVLLMLVTLVWRLGLAVAQVVEATLWPVVLPFRGLRWVVGLG